MQLLKGVVGEYDEPPTAFATLYNVDVTFREAVTPRE
jgi:hypothetical protein